MAHCTHKTKRPKSMPATQPEPVCCCNPTPLIPIVIIAALFILAVVLGAILYQQGTIATQRQQLQACTNHIVALQAALKEGMDGTTQQRWNWIKIPDMTHKEVCDFIHINFRTRTPFSAHPKQSTNWVWLVGSNCPIGFTNTPQYPAAFMLRD